ncbi:chloramphenicol phosphotransferase CPT family protein [Bradyrhizobium sp. NBAIM08]|nr:hypothetical protein [Bradyrhizobium sp. NBAIM08]
MHRAAVILLNGTSSSGKTTLATALQRPCRSHCCTSRMTSSSS